MHDKGLLTNLHLSTQANIEFAKSEEAKVNAVTTHPTTFRNETNIPGQKGSNNKEGAFDKTYIPIKVSNETCGADSGILISAGTGPFTDVAHDVELPTSGVVDRWQLSTPKN